MNKTILSLFDYSGNWSGPYLKTGYNVIKVDIKSGQDVLTFDYKSIGPIYGILAAPPCDHITSSGARWWKEKDADGRTEEHLKLYDKVLEIVNFCQPIFWCLENPVGRLATLRPEFGKPMYSFHPYEFGDPYTKKTCLWGDFIPPLPIFVGKIMEVEPTEGSKMHRLPPSNNRKELRSTTPVGFAEAFFIANP